MIESPLRLSRSYCETLPRQVDEYLIGFDVAGCENCVGSDVCAVQNSRCGGDTA